VTCLCHGSWQSWPARSAGSARARRINSGTVVSANRNRRIKNIELSVRRPDFLAESLPALLAPSIRDRAQPNAPVRVSPEPRARNHKDKQSYANPSGNLDAPPCRRFCNRAPGGDFQKKGPVDRHVQRTRGQQHIRGEIQQRNRQQAARKSRQFAPAWKVNQPYDNHQSAVVNSLCRGVTEAPGTSHQRRHIDSVSSALRDGRKRRSPKAMSAAEAGSGTIRMPR
jgi:hypothetical protein